jgi:predicted RNA-binding Zn ribbon-like protein
MTIVEANTEVLELQVALAVAVEALIIARDAIDDSENTDLPDWLQKILDQHSAMREALARVRPKLRDEVVNDIYKECQKTHKWNGGSSQVQVFMWTGSKNKVREAVEALDGSYTEASVVREVLDGLPGGWVDTSE